ncbi:MAG TPA: hypothetical protein PLO37_25730 [Candidatus Hydrogenedentes bacterium]|nr:hypothetical protein [Candidatus Hydrogenedentota bacterium]
MQSTGESIVVSIQPGPSKEEDKKSAFPYLQGRLLIHGECGDHDKACPETLANDSGRKRNDPVDSDDTCESQAEEEDESLDVPRYVSGQESVQELQHGYRRPPFRMVFFLRGKEERTKEEPVEG